MPCAYVTGYNIINNFRNYRMAGFFLICWQLIFRGLKLLKPYREVWT